MFVGPSLNFACSAPSFTYMAEGDHGGGYCANCNGEVLLGVASCGLWEEKRRAGDCAR